MNSAAPSYEALDSTLASRLIEQAGLADIHAKVEAGERLSPEDGMRLYETPHLAAVGYMAHQVRTRRHGKKAYFNNNLHINYTNVCQYSCKFCAFAAKEGEERAYTMYAADIERKLREYDDLAPTEVHMVAGIHPREGYEYYLDVVGAPTRARPPQHREAGTKVE